MTTKRFACTLVLSIGLIGGAPLSFALAQGGGTTAMSGMIRGGFLDPNIRADLIALVRDGKAETRLTRRANALLLLDDGMLPNAIASQQLQRRVSEL